VKLVVRLFARARDVGGAERIELEIPSSACVGDLRLALAERFPEMSGMAPSLLFAVGTEYADDSAPLESATEVACFPPVSGG